MTRVGSNELILTAKHLCEDLRVQRGTGHYSQCTALSGAALSGATLSGAALRGATLRGATLNKSSSGHYASTHLVKGAWRRKLGQVLRRAKWRHA